MTPEEKRAEAARKKRLYRQTAAGKASMLKWSRSEKGKASQERDRQSEKAKARRAKSIARWKASERGQRMIHKWNNSSRKLAIDARYRKHIRKEQRRTVTAAPAIGELFNKQLMSDALYASVASKVSKAFPVNVRDDIIMEIILAILEGRETLESAAKNTRRFAPDAFKEDGQLTISIYNPFHSEGDLRIIDTITYQQENDDHDDELEY